MCATAAGKALVLAASIYIGAGWQKSINRLVDTSSLTGARRKAHITGMTALFWSLLGFVAILSEFVVPEFVMFFVGVGALATAGLVALVPPIGGSIPLQVLSWLGFTVLSLVALRRHFKSAFGGTIFSRKQRESAVMGKHADVVEEIAPETPGRVRFQGTTWRAVSYNETLSPGARVEILEQKGMTLIVTKSILGGLEDESLSEDSDSKGGPFADESEREWE